MPLTAVLDTLKQLMTSPVEKPGDRKWPKGPTSERKSKTHPVADFIPWVRAVEDAFEQDADDYVVALRRLYYSRFTRGAGAKFDRLLDTPDADAAPLTTDHVPQATLDALFETDSVSTPAGQLVDPSHIFVALDARISGFSFAGYGAGALSSIPSLSGTVTWLGDLASWVLEWSSRVRKKEAELKRKLTEEEQITIFKDPALIKAKVDKDDLLGNMDGQILAQHWDPDTRLSDFLTSYYAAQPPATGLHAARRFHLFPPAATPWFPYQVVNAGPPLQVSISNESRQTITHHIDRTLDFFLRWLDAPPAQWQYHSEIEWDLRATAAWAMGDFLDEGLKSGDAVWPRDPVIYRRMFGQQ